jgi:hypothetical protein
MAARKPNDRTVASVVILTLNPISLSPGSFQMTGLADARSREKASPCLAVLAGKAGH